MKMTVQAAHVSIFFQENATHRFMTSNVFCTLTESCPDVFIHRFVAEGIRLTGRCPTTEVVVEFLLLPRKN